MASAHEDLDAPVCAPRRRRRRWARSGRACHGRRRRCSPAPRRATSALRTTSARWRDSGSLTASVPTLSVWPITSTSGTGRPATSVKHAVEGTLGSVGELVLALDEVERELRRPGRQRGNVGPNCAWTCARVAAVALRAGGRFSRAPAWGWSSTTSPPCCDRRRCAVGRGQQHDTACGVGAAARTGVKQQSGGEQPPSPPALASGALVMGRQDHELGAARPASPTACAPSSPAATGSDAAGRRPACRCCQLRVEAALARRRLVVRNGRAQTLLGPSESSELSLIVMPPIRPRRS